MNPEGLMCLHYLGCDLSPTSSTFIMHHIHKQLGAPASHSYNFNWIKSVQISGAQLPHCGFSILVVIWFVCWITLPSWSHCRRTSYTPQELLNSMGFTWLTYGIYRTFRNKQVAIGMVKQHSGTEALRSWIRIYRYTPVRGIRDCWACAFTICDID